MGRGGKGHEPLTGTIGSNLSETGNTVNGTYNKVQSGTDTYGIDETGRRRGKDFSQHLTGTDGYNLTESGNAATGTFGRVITGIGTYDLQSQGGGITRRIRPRGAYAFTWTESGNSTSGSLSLSQSGTDRFDLLEMFIDISNTSPASRPGTLDFAPVGVTWVNPFFGTKYYWPWEKEASLNPFKSIAADAVVEGVNVTADVAALNGKGMVNGTAALVGSDYRVDYQERSATAEYLKTVPGIQKRAEGALQVIQGGSEAAVATATAEAAPPVAGWLYVRAADNIGTGLRKIWNGTDQDTTHKKLAKEVSKATGTSPETAEKVGNTTDTAANVASLGLSFWNIYRAWNANAPNKIVGRQPANLAEQLAMEDALAGGGKVIMPGPFGDPLYQGAGWVKMQVTHKLPDGTNIVVHYMKNTITGATSQFKFK